MMALTGAVRRLTAFFFKLAVAPFHAWAPDVYEGSPLPSTLYFAVVPKVARVRVVARLCTGPLAGYLDQLQLMLRLGASASRGVAAFSARVQRRLKRFRAYSAIGHMGYVFLGRSAGTREAVQAVVVYMRLYVFMSRVAWLAVMSWRQASTQDDAELVHSAKYLTDLEGMGRLNPFLAASLALTLRSMAGIPPRAGFRSKLWVFLAAMSQSLVAWSLFAVLASCVGAFYYRRLIKLMYFDVPTRTTRAATVDGATAWVVSRSTRALVVRRARPGPVLRRSHRVALSLVS